MKPSITKIVQICATVVLFIVVFYQVGLFSQSGREEFIAVVARADMTFLVLAILIGILVNMSSALKWFMLIRARDMMVGYWRIFAYYLVGQFYNLILPTSVGGDVVRSYELGKYTNSQADALASVFVERYTGLIMLLAMALFAVLTSLSTFNHDFVIVSLTVFSVGLAFLGWFVLDERVYQWCRQWVCGYFPFLEKIFVKLDKLMLSVAVYKNHRTALVWALFNSFVFYLLAVANIYLTAKVFQLDVQWLDMLIATPIIMLIMNIPLSIGNLGLMEFAYISVFQIMGYSPVLGLSVAILMRLKSLLDGAMGGVLHPVYVTKKAD